MKIVDSFTKREFSSSNNIVQDADLLRLPRKCIILGMLQMTHACQRFVKVYEMPRLPRG